MAIRITVEVDEDRLREAGMGTSGEAVSAAVEALRDDSRLALQSRDHWLPVRNLKFRER